MLSASLRARLSRIARGDAPPPADPPPGPLESPALPAEVAAQPWALAFDPQTTGAEVSTAAGCAWRVELTFPATNPHSGGETIAAATPSPVVCLDIETAGLASAPLFLVGLLWADAGGSRLVQLVARDYAEEAVVLEALAALLADAPHWVTYNGGSFDLPYVRDRCAYHRVPPPGGAEHTDLLPLARRQWRGSLADCRLLTVEQAICGRRRLQDVRGADIPGLYHEFVRSGRWEVIAPVLHHNAMDLVTTAELWARIGRGSENRQRVRFR